MLVAGADGYSGGWVVVIAEAAQRLEIESIQGVPSFACLLAVTSNCDAVGVDIPIGLSAGPPRLADRGARRLLTRLRSSSVFPAPVRATLAHTADYLAACAASEACSGRRLSKQTFNILPKIREADEAMTPALQRRVCEVHPEVCFHALNAGVTLADSKHTPAGLAARESLLASVYSERLSLRPLPKGATRDDLYDACAAAWTAARIARDEAQRLPPEPRLDAHGLRMEIVY